MLIPGLSSLDDEKQTSSRRNRTTMCAQCRHDKQKCNPADRDWHFLRQKCERCTRLEYPCGPSRRAQRKTKSRKTSLDTTTPNPLHEGEHQVSPFFEFQSSDLVSPIGYHFQHPTENLSLAALESKCVNLDFVDCQAEYVPYKSTESWIAGVLVQLGDLYATRELLRKELRICDQVEDWTGFSENVFNIRLTTQAVIRAIQEEFENCVKIARNIVTTSTAPTMENMVELYLIAYKFGSPPSLVTIDHDSDEGRIRTPESPNIQWLLHTLHGNTSRHSSADLLCGNISYPATICSPAGTTKTYQEASTSIGRVLSETSTTSLEYSQLHRPSINMDSGINPDFGSLSGYPPCHLAATHGHQLVAFELWKNFSPPQRWELDCYKRTPLHVAAYAGKTDELRPIFEQYANAAMDVSKDVFGLTPVMIAACKDDVKALIWLHKHGADLTVTDLVGRSLLSLAARNGSRSVVKYLLRQGHIPPSLNLETSELCEAIAHKQRPTINLLIGNYDRHKTIDQYDLLQIEAGITAAKRMGLGDITGHLENLYTSCSEKYLSSVDSQAPFLCASTINELSLIPLTEGLDLQQLFMDNANTMDWNPSCHSLQDLDFPDWTILNSTEVTADAPIWPCS